MIKSRFSTLLILFVLSGLVINATESDELAIRPYARNVARVIQDFAIAHARKHQRPEKFCAIPTGKDNNSLLWVSTFDESYGCLFTSAKGRLENSIIMRLENLNRSTLR